MAPIVVSPIETKLIGPMPANEVGRLKIPTPMMLPMISAIATGRPKPPPAAAPAPSPLGWVGATAGSGVTGTTGASGRSRGVSVMAHSLLYERRFFPLIPHGKSVKKRRQTLLELMASNL